MSRRLLQTGLALAVLASVSRPLGCQEPAAPRQAEETIAVFLDCQAYYGCDREHATREIPFVNWMRDRQDADVHVLVTIRQTGGGGQEFTLAFIGLRRFVGQADTLLHIASNTDTEAEMRDAVTRLIKLGLTRFLAKTAVAASLDVTFRAPEPGAAPLAATPADDPWKFWTFRVGGGGFFNGEEQYSDRTVNANVTANRTTNALKVDLRLYGSANRSAYTLSDGTEYVNTSESYSGRLLSVWSLDAHWSAGGTASGSRSTYSNLDLGLSGGPAIEYNIFPYDESTRQMLTLTYSVELASFNYQDTTVTGKLDEILPRHRLGVGAVVQQPWGQVEASVAGTQYLHDLSVHRIDSYAGVTLRLFRGLEFSMWGNFYRIKDQFGLPAAGLEDEEILLRRRAQETDYRYFTYFSIGYRFGSKFANVVNPRMDLAY